MSKQLQLNRTGLYYRLSRDDEKAGESLSIENQRMILRKFTSENGGTIVDEYIDDGWSGTDFERPGVKRLLEDAKDGKIDTIVVKDLSRFGYHRRERPVAVRTQLHSGRAVHRLYLPRLRHTLYRPFGQRGYGRPLQFGHGYDAHYERFQRVARGEHFQKDTRRAGSQMAGGQVHQLGIPLRL